MKFYYLLFALSIIIFSCKDEVKVPDVSNIKVNPQIIRFDTAFYHLDTNKIGGELTALQDSYPAFTKLYFTNILPLGKDTSKLLIDEVSSFLRNKQIRHLYDTTEQIMQDLPGYLKGIKPMLQYLKYYFPKYQEPNFYTFISEYGYQTFIFNDNQRDGIGIGLDMFLGEKYPYKVLDPQNPNYSEYLTRTYNKSHIVPKIADVIIDDLCGSVKGNKMIDYMVHNGKKLYLKKLILPHTNDTLIYEYSKGQLDWVKTNEQEIWSFFLDQNLMYETSINKINKYINASPNAPGMPKDAPGKTANYVGMKIIEAYMTKYPNTSIEQLIQLSDAQQVLEKSKYKPHR